MTKTGFGKVVLSALAALAMAACSGSGSGSDSPGGTVAGITISGSLNTSSASILSVPGEDQMIGELTISPSDLELYGIAFTTPPVAVKVDVQSDGSFELKFPGVADGTAISLIFQTKADGKQVGLVKFEDTTKKDINGDTKKDTSIALKGTVSLGALTLADGEVTVQVSNIQSSVDTSTVAAGELFNPSGSWQLGAIDFSIPDGYVDPFSNTSCGNQSCVQQGENITVVRYSGTEFTPGSSCTTTSNGHTDFSGTCSASDGTPSTTARYAGQIWGGPASGSGSGIAACGYKIGATADEARAMGHIQFDSPLPTVGSTVMQAAHYTMSPPSGWGTGSAPYNRPWIHTSATASRPYQKCQIVEKQGTDNRRYRFFSCAVTVTVNSSSVTRYHAFQAEGGGCFGSNGQPINVDHSFWDSNPSPTSQCSEFTVPVNGFHGGSCPYTGSPTSGAPSTSFTCKFLDGRFSDAALTTSANSENWSGETQQNFISQGAACSTAGNASDAAILAGYQCFSDYYFQHKNDWESTGCANDFRFNWAANRPQDFETGGDRGKPKKLYMFNIMNYSPDGKTFFLEDSEEETETQMMNGSPVICRVDHFSKLQGSKKDASRMLIDLTQGGVLKTNDANCQGMVSNANSNLAERLQTKRMIFYGTRQ